MTSIHLQKSERNRSILTDEEVKKLRVHLAMFIISEYAAFSCVWVCVCMCCALAVSLCMLCPPSTITVFLCVQVVVVHSLSCRICPRSRPVKS